MPFESEFLSMMPHTISVRTPTGKDVYNKATFTGATTRTYRCRITGKILSIRRSGREEQTVVFDIYANTGNDVLTLEDEITLPADNVWQDQMPEIFAVARVSDERGHHHTKIQCGFQYHRQGQ